MLKQVNVLKSAACLTHRPQQVIHWWNQTVHQVVTGQQTTEEEKNIIIERFRQMSTCEGDTDVDPSPGAGMGVC